MSKKDSSDKELNSISNAMEEFIKVSEMEEEETDDIEVEYKPVSMENLEPAFKKSMEALSREIPQEEVNQFLKEIGKKKETLFDKEISEALSDITPEQQKIITQKMEEWNASEEIAGLNAKAFISWMKNQENIQDD